MKTYIGTALSVAVIGVLGAACTTKVIQEQAPTDPVESKNSTDPTSAQSNGSTDSVAPIDGIYVYQGARVALVDGGKVKKLNAPIIAGRPGLVRVHATLAGAKQKVTAKLHLVIGGQETVLTDGPHTPVDYDDADLASTFDFELDATQVTSDLELSVELVNASNQTTDKFPTTDQTLAPQAITAPKLRVELVPVKYESDGSGRVPDVGDTVMKSYRDSLYRLYPVADVEITQHATLDWPVEVDPMGDGWDKLLQAVMQLRQDDGVDEDVYYVGVFEPVDDVGTYCASGCVLGVAPYSEDKTVFDTDMSFRTALVTGYQTDKSGSTLAQELAHAMDRLHAPCGNPSAVDQSYPYDNGQIGTAGYDVLGKTLMSTATYYDFMSYCFPAWVSDYTYKSIAARMQTVAQLKGQTTQSLTFGPKPAVKLLGHDDIGWMIQQPKIRD